MHAYGAEQGGKDAQQWHHLIFIERQQPGVMFTALQRGCLLW